MSIKMQKETCIHIYCGDGKGKTSIAIGTAIRAAGRQKKVLIVRFLKNDDSGELFVLEQIPNIEVVKSMKTFGFTFAMSEERKSQAREYYSKLLEDTIVKVQYENYDLLILDEIMAACNEQMVEENQLVSFLKNKPSNLEIILTGRRPSQELLLLADYVSEVNKIKHPFDRGLQAREGIEF